MNAANGWVALAARVCDSCVAAAAGVCAAVGAIDADEEVMTTLSVTPLGGALPVGCAAARVGAVVVGVLNAEAAFDETGGLDDAGVLVSVVAEPPDAVEDKATWLFEEAPRAVPVPLEPPPAAAVSVV